MTDFRGIPLSLHAGLEVLAAPAIMVAPFIFGFGQGATVICVLVGALLLTLSLQIPGPSRVISLSSHASFDYALAVFAIAAGLATGLASGAWGATIFMVGVGAAMAALTAATRFSQPRGV